VPEAALFGLAAACCWGFTDLTAAIAGRRIGTLRAATVILASSASFLVVLLVGSQTSMDLSIGQILLPVGIGVLAAVSTLALWTALRLGPVAVVSPIAATVGAGTVLLSWLLLGERPGPIQWLAVVIAVIGCVLVSTRSGTSTRLRLVGRGPLFALAAVGGYTLIVVGLRAPVQELGWLPVAAITRVANVIVVWSIFALSQYRRSLRPTATPTQRTVSMPSGPIGWRLYVLMVIAGVLEASGLSALTLGLDIGPVWLVGLLASPKVLIVVLGGIVLFGERPARRQWYGAAAIAVAVVLVVLGRP
jgi:uncharacterized membrane protein